MNVTQLLQRLSYGPLANLSMSNDGDGTIADNRKKAVIAHANDGLLELYTKFNLREAELIIQQDETITAYRINSKYSLENAAANPTLPHYIIDSPTAPFTDDFVKILRVVSEFGDVPLNDDNRDDSVYTPSIDLLQVPDPEQGKPLYIIYQAKHLPISDDYSIVPDFGNQIIDLPAVLEEALVSYVAYKIYFHMNGQENTAKASDHFQNYNRVCAEVTENDLVSTSLSSTSSKFGDRGFC